MVSNGNMAEIPPLLGRLSQSSQRPRLHLTQVAVKGLKVRGLLNPGITTSIATSRPGRSTHCLMTGSVRLGITDPANAIYLSRASERSHCCLPLNGYALARL